MCDHTHITFLSAQRNVLYFVYIHGQKVMFDIGHNYYVNDKIKNRWLSRQTLPYFFLSSTKFENQCAEENEEVLEKESNPLPPVRKARWTCVTRGLTK
jgi:hypothetical protein